MPNEDLTGVMRRIAKLLAIAEDSRANANEAASAARMAEAVMRKYQIEHADVLTVELRRGDAESFASEDVGSSLNPEGASTESSGWAGILGVDVAQLHDCQVSYERTPKHGKTLRFSGYAADAKMARFTYVYLVTTMAAASREFTRLNGGGRRAAEDFRRGFNSAMCKNLKEALLEKRAQMAEASDSRALVIVKGQAVVKHFGEIKYGMSRGWTTGDSFTEGFDRGSSVDVNRRGVGHTATSAHPLLG